MSWTQAICANCWDDRNPERKAWRHGHGDWEICCYCGEHTDTGIYIRADPATVAYPRAEAPS